MRTVNSSLLELLVPNFNVTRSGPSRDQKWPKKIFGRIFRIFLRPHEAAPYPIFDKKVNLVGTERKSQGTFVPMRPTYGPNYSFLRPLGGPQIDKTVGKTLFLRGRLRAEDGRIRPRPFYAKSLFLTQILKVLLWPDLCDVILGVRSAVEERSFFARKWLKSSFSRFFPKVDFTLFQRPFSPP